MKGLIGNSKVSLLGGMLTLTLGGMALVGASSDVQPTLWLSPSGAETGKTLDADEPFEMTLHLAADPNATYDLAVTYTGDAVGTCGSAAAQLLTNPEGKATWTCDFDTAANAGDAPLVGSVVFTVAGLEPLLANLTVRAAQKLEPEATTTPTTDPERASGATNHGHCVSYWARASKAQGLRGSARGAFISSIARDPAAVSPKGTPGAACDFQDELDAALDAQGEVTSAKPARTKVQGKPSGGKGKK